MRNRGFFGASFVSNHRGTNLAFGGVVKRCQSSGVLTDLSLPFTPPEV